MLAWLDKHKTGASCVYVSKLAEVDTDVLQEIARRDRATMQRVYRGNQIPAYHWYPDRSSQ